MNMSLHTLPDIFNIGQRFPATELKKEEMSLDDKIQKKILGFHNLAYQINNNEICKKQLVHRIDKLERFINEHLNIVSTDQEKKHLKKLEDLTNLIKEIPKKTLTKKLTDIYISTNKATSADNLEIALYKDELSTTIHDVDWKAVGKKIKPNRCQIITLSLGATTTLTAIAGFVMIYVCEMMNNV